MNEKIKNPAPIEKKQENAASIDFERVSNGRIRDVYVTDELRINHAVEEAVKTVLSLILLKSDSKVSLKKRVALVKEIAALENKADVSPIIRCGYFEAVTGVKNLLFSIEESL